MTNEKSGPATPRQPQAQSHWRRVVAVVLLVYLAFSSLSLSSHPTSPDYSHLADYCTSSVSPISANEYSARQESLGSVLHSLNASAYIAEPGPNAFFFANVSTTQWFLSERPLLFIISPEFIDEEIHPKLSVLAPKFEATRAKLLPIPFPKHKINWIEWPEEANPYELSCYCIIRPTEEGGKVFVDGAMRHFIVDGLQKALPESTVLAAPAEVKQLREKKSKAELEILKCAHETTLLSIREVHKHLYIGIRESEARKMMASALTAAGLTDGGCLTLFGENAALPHGSGSDRVLTQGDFALFDCTASLLGYRSDITRTVALPDTIIPEDHLTIWMRVRTVQDLVYASAKEGVLTGDLDQLARKALTDGRYGQYFTHRLGHGIGIEGHESPYLVGGSKDVIKTGNAFSNEPGVYIEGKVGVRLEDCFYIDEDGKAVFLTQGVGGMASSPLRP
ncbi:hypothetical protein D9758_001656 [Tetrapyrgos nigripes]|uniref:Peptidase M24 domain-containing protein n=1 Tax=Tetrapyrgos nigripes TaxID=182062 RepID=A0A8H5GXE6_9AGAR|nr:hypothetical protein D9758_001656 [Tetrapyrgos nigripes]